MAALAGGRSSIAPITVIFLQHRHKESSSSTYEFNAIDAQWIAVDVSLLGRKIGNVNHLLRCSSAAETSSWTGTKHRLLSPKLGQCRRRVVLSCGAEVLPVVEIQ